MKASAELLHRWWLASYTLAEREVVRFLRERHRVFGALLQPVIFWAVFGLGLNASFTPKTGPRAISYAEYFFPGTVILVLLFTAIFATISIIEDRNAGFLQGVLVAPVPRMAIVAGKVAGTTALAVIQALAVMFFAPAVGIYPDAAVWVQAAGVLTIVALGLGAVGFAIAWGTDSTQGFHAIMTAVLMPMWILSGAFFPLADLPGWIVWLPCINPLTYGLAALRRLLYATQPEAVAGLPSMAVCLTVVLAFDAAALAFAGWLAGRRERAKKR
ncbi:MAG: hypothetical protein D6815_11355 [Candidatus Dadabacteria bacterium]|nr:MAG: hypothetical protein D6815_11355 [Candidatus Dadabacteria bacterium]